MLTMEVPDVPSEPTRDFPALRFSTAGAAAIIFDAFPICSSPPLWGSMGAGAEAEADPDNPDVGSGATGAFSVVDSTEGSPPKRSVSGA